MVDEIAETSEKKALKKILSNEIYQRFSCSLCYSKSLDL